MKNIYLITILITCAIGFTACKDDEKGCGEEGIAALAIYDESNYATYYTADPTAFGEGVTVGDVNYKTYYESQGGISRFSLKAEFKNVCRDEAPLMSAQLQLAIPDASVGDTMYFSTIGESTTIKLPVTNIGSGIYDRNEYMTIPAGNGPATIGLVNAVNFPSQGSRAADSVYFFGNLVKYDVNISCKKVE